jgi:hypothetical protein
MKLTISSKTNAQTIIDLFNAVVNGEVQEHQATPMSIYDDDKHICSIVAANGELILELIIEREQGDVICSASECINGGGKEESK